MALQHAANGIAQQGGVVARQGRNDQHRRLTFERGQGGAIVRKALEAAQFAKRFVNLDALVDRDIGLAAVVHHRHGFDPKLRANIVFAQAVGQIEAGSSALGEGHLAKAVHRAGIELGGGFRKLSKRLHE